MRGLAGTVVLLALSGCAAWAPTLYDPTLVSPRYENVPAAWLLAASRATERFRSGHQSNMDCFDVTLSVHEDGLLYVSFLPVQNVSVTQERIVIEHTSECGRGETFKFDRNGRLVDHVFVRH